MSAESSLDEILGSGAVTIPPDVMDEICSLIHENTGLRLEKTKYRLRLRRKVKRQMRSHDVDRPRTYLNDLLRNNQEQLLELIEAVTVNETLFYRYPEQMKWLQREFFPRFLESDRDELRVLSAGCSTGAEPYSTAIALAETFRRKGYNPHNPPVNPDIVGIDISHEALDQARSAQFDRRPVENAPRPVQKEYFEPIHDDQYKLDEFLQEWVSFQQGNLLDCPLPDRNDLVLLRNVLIYFDQGERRSILNRLYEQMPRSAPLIMGHSEDISDFNHWYRELEDAPDGVFERWSTDRRESTVTDSITEAHNNKATHERRQSPEDHPEPEFEQSYRTDGVVLLELSGVLGQNISPSHFRNRLINELPTEECDQLRQLHLNLRPVPYMDNEHLEALGETILNCVSDGGRITIHLDDEDMADSLEQLVDSTWFETSLEPPPSADDVERRTPTDKTSPDSNQPSSSIGTASSPDDEDGSFSSKASSPSPDRTEPSPSSPDQSTCDQFPGIEWKTSGNGLTFTITPAAAESLDNEPFEVTRCIRGLLEDHDPSSLRINLPEYSSLPTGLKTLICRLDGLVPDVLDKLQINTADNRVASRLRDLDLPVQTKTHEP